ncbi:VanZ family protein [Streptomyces sp. SS7]|uniref:VanZ family protein n=1 Tax=Streptomyces sp. SS7 TaxID=3108485 RepID=UPI0030EF85A9
MGTTAGRHRQPPAPAEEFTMGDVHFEIGATTVLGPLPAAYGLLVAVRARRGRAGWTGRHAVTRMPAAAYAAGVLALTLFPVVVTYGEYANLMPWTNQINWVPVPSPDPSILANVVLTVPLGVLLPLTTARLGAAWRSASRSR